MKLLFIHDHPFYKDKNDLVYSPGAFNNELWKNYLINFNEINIFSRKSYVQPTNKSLSSRENVNFHLTTNYTSVKNLVFKYTKLVKEIETLVIANDVILLRLPSVLGVIASFVALKHHKLIWVEQVANAQEALSNHGSLLGKVTAPILHHYNQKIAKKAHFISYVTEKKLQSDYPCHPKAIQVALSDVIINKVLKPQVIDKNRFYDDKLKIGIIGGFDAKYKGFDVMLKAVSLLPKEVQDNIEFYFIGKGDHQWITQLAYELNLVDNIKFIGPLQAGEKVNEMLKSISLYAQPSFTEGMPRALLEAMAMGCPCLGSNVGGIPDILNQYNIHIAGNYELLSNHISYYYHNREKLEEESTNNLDKISPYLFDNLNLKRIDFYNKMNNYINNLN
ncbi:MAG TPA: hypothetical protein DEG63_05770 [Flavobacteriaceae bacterium]|nr:hypothetical protein [Flavobacteriaceae bacterium]